jgi:hypothetical protein
MKELYEPKMVLGRHCTNELHGISACIYVTPLRDLTMHIIIHDECVDAFLQFSPDFLRERLVIHACWK